MYILSLSMLLIVCRIKKYGNSRQPATPQLGVKPVIGSAKLKNKIGLKIIHFATD
jgi:hypothetical protein